MQKTKIEWVKNPDGTQGYSWNPIKGICPVGCWYCYGKKYYQRFKKLYLDIHGDGIRFSLNECWQVRKLRKPSKIFVCSTFELFHPITNTLLFPLTEGSDTTYRDMIFMVIKDNPQHTFQILTKFPQNIDREMPDNVWLGVTITGEEGTSEKSYELEKVKAKIKFISYEPMIENRAFCVDEIDWLILGKLTGYGKKYDPPKDWIRQMISLARVVGIPIFLKDNLKEIWEEPLIQEMPE